MVQKWFISDTHFNHANMLKFRTKDNKLVRPEFKNVEEMNEVMIENWNKNVKPEDKIYHLGDVALGLERDFNNVMRRLNGKKTLILGNHDNFDMKTYGNWFREVWSYKNFHQDGIKFIATHCPCHEETFYPRKKFVNVHGHIHEKHIDDPRYMNLSVEVTGYKPVPFEDVLAYAERHLR